MMNRERMTRQSSRTMGNAPTSLGLSERLERVLAYPFLWLSGLLLFVLERKNANVQFHARQSMAVFGPLCIIWWLTSFLGGIVGGIWVIGFILAWVFSFLASVIGWVVLILAIWLMIMAWFRPAYRLPFVGNWIR
jgi:uncharacterized membrane protein